ncbi:GTP cyclohydrolase [Legionella wadsworthii]|uniref:GTP cyclohydrolase n=2 Tax=Legionella wadsworthii TaxID=28088 RepID=A0A378LUC4_9GAMM|nr:GTP cyclohydrolase [Legionella wadsworthii]
MVAIAELLYDCSSPNIIESKSLKLYFNSFNNTRINNVETLKDTITKDLQERVGAEVVVKIYPLDAANQHAVQPSLDGESLDHLDIECSEYLVDPSTLTASDELVEESLFSNLLKSNCLVTNQPDWGSVQIIYKGKKINREGLLKYIISYRNHNEFHEQCIERIFIDIMNYCKPEKLTVYGRYTRRGGLDINPYRSTEKTSFAGKNLRLVRQ